MPDSYTGETLCVLAQDESAPCVSDDAFVLSVPADYVGVDGRPHGT